MFSAARPALARAIRDVNDPSTSWSSVSFAAMALAWSRAMAFSAASIVTRPSPFLWRNSEINCAGEAAAAATVLAGSASKSKTANRDMVQPSAAYDFRHARRGRGVAAALGADDAVDDGH